MERKSNIMSSNTKDSFLYSIGHYKLYSFENIFITIMYTSRWRSFEENTSGGKHNIVIGF